MEKISEIGKSKFGVGLFKTLKAKTDSMKQTNPFGISFKGDVIHADVFETASKPVAKPNVITEKGKVFISTIVGSVNSFNNSLKSRLNSIVSFGRQTRDNIVSFWEKSKNTEISFDIDGFTKFIKSKLVLNPNSVSNLTKRPVKDLEKMLLAELL